MIINDLDGYYIVFDTKNWNTELDTLPNNTTSPALNTAANLHTLFLMFFSIVTLPYIVIHLISAAK